MNAVTKYAGLQIVNLAYMGFIYCLVEKVDDKFIHHYIGMTSKTYNERISEHLEKLDEQDHYNDNLQSLYNKNKFENFSVIVRTSISCFP